MKPNIELNIYCKNGHLIGNNAIQDSITIDFDTNELRYWCSKYSQNMQFPARAVIELQTKRSKDE